MKQTIPGGFLLAIEGVDGAGKSAQVEAVSRALRNRGLDCLVTREPTNGHWGRLIRDSALKGRLSPQDELKAFIEDRKEHVRDVIGPGLQAGRIVITDRYYFSTVAYQGARGLDPDELLRLNESFAIEPHLLVVIDLHPETSLARIGNRDGVGNHFESLAQLARSRQIYQSLKKPYLVCLDGQARPDDLRDAILVAFSRFATAQIAAQAELTPRQKLDAIFALHGSPSIER
jgi:dTMP kinase